MNPTHNDDDVQIISLETYIRQTFKKFIDMSSDWPITEKGRIARNAVSNMNLFLNEFICDVTRSAMKITRNSNRTTIMEKDIDVAVYTLYHPAMYDINARGDNIELYHEHFREFSPIKIKSRYTLKEKYNVDFPPARIEKIMRMATEQEKIRIAEKAIIFMTILVSEIVHIYIRHGMNSVKKIREVVDSTTRKKTRYLGTITWKDIMQTENKYKDVKVSMCKYNKRLS